MLDLFGAVALLVWGLRMVKTGVERAFGLRLRRAIAAGTRNRVMAFVVGLVVTLALQSSTATALMTASFAGGGYMTATMAQAIMLGANVGTSLVTRVLAFDMHELSPLFIAIGVFGFIARKANPYRAGARALLGLGLMLLALQEFGRATEPMRSSPVLAALMTALDSVPVLGVAVAAVLALGSSSSLVVVLLTMSLAEIGKITPPLGISLVLGANVGGAVPPVLASLGSGPLARRVTFGNLTVRLAGCLLTLAFTREVAGALSIVSPAPAMLVVNAHIALNIALGGLALPLLGPLSAAMRQLFPDQPAVDGGPRHLDENVLGNPAIALAAATRETLRMGDCVAAMLEKIREALRLDDMRRCKEVEIMDDEVDRLNDAVKMYVAKLGSRALPEREERRAAEIVAYATELEHMGDIVDKNLRELVAKKIRNQLSFSAEGLAEIDLLYAVTLENLQLAQSIMVSQDTTLARQLIQAKVDIRYREARSAAAHRDRLRAGQIASVQTSSLHLDILRDLKRINAHIAAIAYPILSDSGMLRETRLVDDTM